MSEARKTVWGAVLVAVLAGAMASAHVGKLPPAMPLIRAELGVSLLAAGFLLSLFNLLGMTVAVLFGGLADRLGRRRLVLAGFVCLALGGALGALSPNLALLMVSRLVEGVGFVAVTVALPFVIGVAAAPKDRGLALSLWSVYHPMGMAMAMLASPVLLTLMGWRELWWVIVAVSPLVGWAVLAQMRRLDLPPPGNTPFLHLALAALRVRGFRLIGLVFLAYAFQWVTLMAWLPTFLTESFGADLAFAGLVSALVVLANVPGCLFGSEVVRRGFSITAMVLTGTAVMVVCTLGLFLPGLPDAVRIGLAVVFSFFGGLIPPALFAAVPKVAPEVRLISTGNGMLMQGSAIGQFIGAPMVAAAVSAGGGDWRWALGPMLAFAALTAVAGVMLRR